MKAQYLIIYKDKVMDNHGNHNGEIEAKTMADIERKVRSIAAKKIHDEEFQADMKGRYEIEQILVDVTFY